MDMNSIIEKIKACDDQYLSLFCTKGREWGLFVYQDHQLPELSDHNFLRIPDHIPAGRLRGLADVARNTAKATGRPYLRMELPQPLNYSSASSEQWGCYYLSDAAAITDSCDADLSFRPVDDEEKAQQLQDLELSLEGDPDFSRRRTERFSKVYLAENGLTCWLCCRGEKIVARGELFVADEVAKIANIAVSPEEDRDEVAAALRQHLIKQGREQGAELIYATAAADIAGFTKARDIYALTWRF